MRKFLYFLGSALYGAAASYVILIFFRWFHGFASKALGGLADRTALYVLVLLAAAFVLYIVFVYASTVIAFPLKLMRNETDVVKYVPSLLLLAAGFLAGRLPWLSGPFGFTGIAFGVVFDFLVCNVVFCVILFTWKKTMPKSDGGSPQQSRR